MNSMPKEQDVNVKTQTVAQGATMQRSWVHFPGNEHHKTFTLNAK